MSTEPPSYELVRPLSGTIKTLIAQWPQLQLRNDVLYRVWLNTESGQVERWQLIPPPNRRNNLIQLSHTGMTGGHLGLRRTSAQLRKRVYWPSWKDDVQREINRCTACSRYRREKPPRQGLLQDMRIGEPMDRVGIDITGPHPASNSGFKYILTVIDHFSRWAEAFPIRNQEAVTVARVLCDQFISRFGCPRQILSDQGPCFESRLFQDLCRQLQIDKIRTSPYKPSTNGMVERFHKTLNSMLGKVVSARQKDWDVCLPGVMAAYRATPHSSTGFSPNLLFTGRETIAPIDLVLGDNLQIDPAVRNVNEFVDNLLCRLQDTYVLVRSHTLQSAQFRTARYNLRARPVSFVPGQLVWYYCPRRITGVKMKWARFYDGPYKILDQVGPVLYRVQRTARSLPKLVYVDKLKPYSGESPKNWEATAPEEAVSLGESVGLFELPLETNEGTLQRPKRSHVLPARYRL